MKKKNQARLAMGLFLAACLVPSVGMLLLPEAPAAANQTLSPAPRLTQEGGAFNPAVLQETADYVSDHLAFRQEMITAAAALDAKLFRTSAQEKVTLGRGDWLFYTETVEDYLRTAPLTDRQLYAAARTLALLEEHAASKGARLYVTVAPNKASLYPQYLPPLGAPLEGQDGIDRLVPLLQVQGVDYIDLFTPFRAREEELYYHTDSHWTNRGAALACDVLTAAMGVEAEPFFPGTVHAGGERTGDLYEMLYPAGTGTETEEVYDRPFTFTYTRQPRSAEDQRMETENPDRTGGLLLFRDSFGNSLHPFLADAWGSALISRAMPYEMALLDGSGADTVLIEIVERNLDYWVQRPPVFPAPERMLTGVPPDGAATASLTARDDGKLEGYVRLDGTLTGEIDWDSPVYIQLSGRLFEASPAGEADGAGTPFTAYVERSLVQGEASVLYTLDGALYASAAAVEKEG